ncbi:MAG: hemerythrin family protein [Deltaproteobacteria bacterium]|nr:hemerythrin family protein [Deltaproteobacteria bacterium]
MPIITWEKSYSVGVDELDGHHKQLINMINELYYAMKNDRGQSLVNDIISDMLSYAEMHFEIEEGYMRRCEYLGMLQHFREHEHFIKKAQDLARRSKEGEFVLSFEVIQFLSDWLKSHILETDMKYVPLFKEKGLC